MTNPNIQDKRQYHRARPLGMGSWAMFATEADMRDAMGTGEPYEESVVWMTPAEFEALPDHLGW